ncbi:MAG: hypothetical protein R6W71_07350 [Bacteroidales bacterium]
MIHPVYFEEKIGFRQVREMLQSYCLSEPGVQLVSEMIFMTEPESIRRNLRETREFLTILENGLPFPSSDYYDLTPVLDRIQTPGSWIFTEELYELRLSLHTPAVTPDTVTEP